MNRLLITLLLASNLAWALGYRSLLYKASQTETKLTQAQAYIQAHPSPPASNGFATWKAKRDAEVSKQK